MANPGGASNIVGTVDNSGSGVPLRLCNPRVNPIDMKDELMVARHNALHWPFAFRATISFDRVISPAKKNV